MNVYGLTVLTALLLGFFIEILAAGLNLKALREEPPPALAAEVDGETYRRTGRYTRARTALEMAANTLGLAGLLLWWFAGGFDWLDRSVAALGFGPVVTGVLFIGLLMIFSWLLGLPLSLYGTFVLEARFGFNKTTPRTYVLDLIKTFFLAIVLGGPLLAAILIFFDHAGPLAWLYCWGGVTVFMLVVQYVAPTWLMPLFNRFTPLPEGPLRQAIVDYARSVGFSLGGIFEVDGSRRSTKANAFFTGFGGNRRIALFDTLIRNHTVSELLAVLAHEVGHYKKKHIPKTLALGILHLGVMFWLLSLVLNEKGLHDAFFMERQTIHAGLVFFALLYTPVELLLTPLLKWNSRRNEFQADRYALETVPDPGALATALKKLAVDHLSNLTPHPFYVMLHYGHPPLIQRLEAMDRFLGRDTDPPGTGSGSNQWVHRESPVGNGQ